VIAPFTQCSFVGREGPDGDFGTVCVVVGVSALVVVGGVSAFVVVGFETVDGADGGGAVGEELEGAPPVFCSAGYDVVGADEPAELTDAEFSVSCLLDSVDSLGATDPEADPLGVDALEAGYGCGPICAVPPTPVAQPAAASTAEHITARATDRFIPLPYLLPGRRAFAPAPGNPVTSQP